MHSSCQSKASRGTSIWCCRSMLEAQDKIRKFLELRTNNSFFVSNCTREVRTGTRERERERAGERVRKGAKGRERTKGGRSRAWQRNRRSLNPLTLTSPRARATAARSPHVHPRAALHRRLCLLRPPLGGAVLRPAVNPVEFKVRTETSRRRVAR